MYIILALVAIAVLAVICVFLWTFFRLATGRMSKEEKERILAQSKREKLNKKKGSSHHSSSFLSYPSPLNNWGLWH
ncbi:MAG: hypothetical protein KBS70_08035 [Bacteroidales bacterium]|nr:hypothetical protein [Candidatus Colicola caccequi]MBQ0154711.1 hypothetical protein [Candidatus Colicola equi]